MVDGVIAERWNGTFEIYGVSGSQFKYYMAGEPPAGTMDLSNATAAKVIAFRSDDVINAIPAGSRVHLGPTPPGQPFLTRGYADGVSGGLQVKAGMRISGAGVDATTVQLVPRASANTQFFAFGHALRNGSLSNLADFLETSDLTVDCN